MSEARVAVVIPCWNDGATLEQTLESVRHQESCEIVVVDDGSTDPATIELMERLPQRGISVIRQSNRGAAAARMAAVAATYGRYVLPLDADDLLTPGALTELADALDATPEAALVWGDQITFGDAEIYMRTAPVLDPWWITYENRLPMTSLIRRHHLELAGGWSLGEGYEDWDLWMSFAERGFTGHRIPFVTLRYRLHGSRLYDAGRKRHDEHVARLERRHATLIAARRENRKRSTAPLRLRLLLPVVWALPVSRLTKTRIGHLLSVPRRVFDARLARLKRA